ncbi:MAG: COX15/CtaA family protein [Deltaproteobacteria bacterium]
MLGRVTVGLLFLLLVWGNLVAGLKAGLACPDWPLCHGKVLPPFRWDIYMEFGHRVIAAVASVFLVALAARRFRRYEGSARSVPVLAILLLLTEIGMGGAVVLLETPVRLTTVHFMIGLLVFLLAFYMMTFDGERVRPAFAFRGPAALFLSTAALVFSQSALGAYVRHLEAGLACPDFPTCLGEWIPPLLTGPVLVHFSHRTLGYLVLLTAAMIYRFVRRDPRRRADRPLALSFLVLVALQIGIGALVVLSGLSYLATALHLATALGMLSILVHLWGNAVRAEGASLSLPRN